MKFCFFVPIAFAMALIISSPVSAELIVNGDFETVTAGTPYDTFDGWTYGWQDKTDGSVTPSTDSVISGNKSVKLGFTFPDRPNWHGALTQNVETGPTWHAELDFAILTGTGRALGVNILCAAPSTTDNKERITLKSDGAKLYYTAGTSWVDAGLSANAFETAGSTWTGQTPTVNHLEIDGYFNAPTPYYTLTLNGETSANITGWQFGSGVVESGSTVFNFGVSAAYGGSDDGDLNTWLADNISMVSVPEPASIVLLISSVLLLGIGGWRRR